MISATAFWTALAVASAGTYAVRTVPLLLAGRVAALPSEVRRALRMIAPSALAALVALAVARPDGELDLVAARPLAALVAIVVAWRTRSPLATIGVGMAVLVVLEAL
ncbi:MAG: AzlD domain-containing protein [Actinomycetota bacterium]